MEHKEEQEANENDTTKLDFHPLHFPDILKNVFNRLNWVNLKNCRLVCSTWCTEATKVVGEHTEIKFQTPPKLRRYVTDIFPFREENNPESRVYSIANSKNIHLYATALIRWETPRKPEFLQNLTTDFIAYCGDRVRILDLEFRLTPKNKLEKILQSPNLTNLKKIIVHVDEIEECFLNFTTWKFPRTTEIEMNAILEDEDKEECKQILRAQLLQTPATPNLNNLNI